jgi:hypothetical protein
MKNTSIGMTTITPRRTTRTTYTDVSSYETGTPMAAESHQFHDETDICLIINTTRAPRHIHFFSTPHAPERENFYRGQYRCGATMVENGVVLQVRKEKNNTNNCAATHAMK